MARWDLVERAIGVDTHLARSRADLASALARRELSRQTQLRRQAPIAAPVMVAPRQERDLGEHRRAA